VAEVEVDVKVGVDVEGVVWGEVVVGIDVEGVVEVN
jgi:hypothetical protein